MNCTFTIYAIYPLTFMVYKYGGLQVFDATQNLSCKASYKTFIFLIMKLEINKYMRLVVEKIAKKFYPTFAHKKKGMISI